MFYHGNLSNVLVIDVAVQREMSWRVLIEFFRLFALHSTREFLDELMPSLRKRKHRLILYISPLHSAMQSQHLQRFAREIDRNPDPVVPIPLTDRAQAFLADEQRKVKVIATVGPGGLEEMNAQIAAPT